MRAPGIRHRLAGPTARSPAHFLFKLKQNEIVKILPFEIPRCGEPSNPAANDRYFYALPVIRCHFKILPFAYHVTQAHSLSDDLTFRKFASYIRLARRQSER